MTDERFTTEAATPDHAAIDELAERVRRSRVELTTTDPTADHADLAPVGDALDDACIVGLGEATHGTREFFQLKHRIIRHMIERQGLRLVTIETNLPETVPLNDYIVHGEGDPRDALDGTYFWVWRTESVCRFVEWLREFNEDRPLDDRVRLYGIDAQYTAGAVESLSEFLGVGNPDLHEKLRADLAAADDDGETNEQHMSDHDPEATDRLLDRLGTAFEEQAEAFVGATSERETMMARRCLRIVEQVRQRRVARKTGGIQASMVVRDEAMAENLAWVLEYEDADRAVLWAHDSHVCRTVNFGATTEPAPSLGSYLADRYGEEYFALGFDFLDGSFRAIGVGLSPESDLSAWALDEPPADAITRLFAATGDDVAFLDFDDVSEGDRLDAWLAEPRTKRELGAIYYGSGGPSENETDGQTAHNASRDLPEAFDGLLFVRATTPSQVLDDRG